MHCLTNFKNFEQAELDLFAPLTVLLGRNGSGKTNLIEGVELLANLARGVPLNEITDMGRGGRFEVRGGLRSCLRFSTKKLRLQFNRATVSLDGEDMLVDYFMEIALGKKNRIHLSAERLQMGRRVFFDATSSDGEVLDITYDNFSRGPNPHCQLSASSSVLSRYDEVIANTRTGSLKQQNARRTVDAVTSYLRRSHIFDPQPKIMREYERVELQPQLLRNGSNLSAVLFALEKGDKAQKAALKRITRVIRQIPEEPFKKIGFAETQLGDVMAGFVARSGFGSNGERLIDARLLSDGTLRMLAVLAALETIPTASRIVIEEFDSGLHPSRAKLLIDELAAAAKRRKLNILVSTHNPAFMNAMDDSQMDNVLLCHREESRGAARLTRLGDLDIDGIIAARGGLGDFITRGALDKYLRPKYGEERAQAMREWIESLS